MALTKGPMDNTFVSDERLYLDADGKVVKDGDPSAASLLVAEGGTISADDAARYGLADNLATAEGSDEAAPAKPEPKAPAKAAAKKPAARKK